MVAAIAAADRARSLGMPLAVDVLERDDRVGRSILATGNGRCNFSNAHPYADDYRNEDFVRDAFFGLFAAFGAEASERESKLIRAKGGVVHAFFHQLGLAWREEDDGRQYPATNKASTVVDVLRAAAAQLGVREECERSVAAIEGTRAAGGPLTLRMSDGVFERADAVIVACGGRGLANLDVAGLHMLPQAPVLGPLRVAQAQLPIVRELDNIRVRCTVSLVGDPSGRTCQELGRRTDGDGQDWPSGHRLIARETGEVLFRKYGVSGICVFNLSRFVVTGDQLHINLLGDMRACDARDFLFGRRKLLAARFKSLTCEDMLRGLVLPRVADAVLKQAGLAARNKPFGKEDVAPLAKALTSFCLEVAGIGDADVCQVRRGGLAVADFCAQTMEARAVPGLYAAGEALDVDGPCGGYNLHWAWSSGLLAGRSAAEALLLHAE